MPGALDELIGRLLAKNPESRPATAREVRERLARWAARPTRSTGPAAAAAVPAVAPVAAPAVRAQAAVVSPTRSMPALDVEAEPAAVGSGRFRLGPAGIAAVAIGAAIVAALAVAMFTGQRPGPTAGQADPARGHSPFGAGPNPSSAAPVTGSPRWRPSSRPSSLPVPSILVRPKT